MSQNKYTNLIQINAESIGIKTLDNEIIDYLNVEIEEKIKAILTQAKKFMRISKRKTLKVDDLNHSLRFFNFKQLYGYDSYANAEYERVDTVNGLWRPKQNIIDLEDYLSKPIVSCPMQPFPHFHWIAIDGKRPNIPENFIREEFISKVEGIQQIKENQEVIQTLPQTIQSKKVSQPVIHNISKELQIFLENFEQRFRKEIKISRLSTNPLFTVTKELQISLNVIENEPGVVELLPYFMEFLMSNLTNQQYRKEPKVHMLILTYINSILKNPFFYLEPYVHQITTLILSLLLSENNNYLIELVILVKDYAVQLLKILYLRYEMKYPNFMNQLLDVFKENVLSFKNDKVSYLTSYGAIKGINILGPAHIINIILPNLDKFISQVSQDYYVDEKSVINTEKLNDSMIIDDTNKITFSQFGTFPLGMGHSSLFSEISNTNIVKSEMIIDDVYINKRRLSVKDRKKAFYVYYALKESVTLIFNYITKLQSESAQKVFEKISESFGEDILPNFINQENECGLELLI